MQRFEDSRSPWNIIDAKHQKWAQLELMSVLLEKLDESLEAGVQEAAIPENRFRLRSMPMLSEVELNQDMDVMEYRKQLAKCQKKLAKLHNELYRKKVPVIIAYEGWDAAGKGGNIKRIAGALDRAGMMCTLLPVLNRMRNRDIICGVSGQDFLRQAISLFLTEHGTEGLWSRGLRASAARMTGREPTMR